LRFNSGSGFGKEATTRTWETVARVARSSPGRSNVA
jgi:hypothetical protein